jgi:hypothetical protein
MADSGVFKDLKGLAQLRIKAGLIDCSLPIGRRWHAILGNKCELVVHMASNEMLRLPSLGLTGLTTIRTVLSGHQGAVRDLDSIRMCSASSSINSLPRRSSVQARNDDSARNADNANRAIARLKIIAVEFSDQPSA